MNRRNLVKLILTAACAAIFALNVSAQEENDFKEEDLQTRLKMAQQKLETATHRATIDYAFYTNDKGVPDLAEKTVREVVPPQKSEHSATERKWADGSTTRSEYVRVGARQFARENGGEWNELKNADGYGYGIGSGTGSGNSQMKIERNVERSLKKGERVGDRTVDLYETVTTVRYVYPSKTRTEISRDSYWFDADGRFVKTENEYSDSEARTHSTNTKIYEYDVEIKIQAPRVKAKALDETPMLTATKMIKGEDDKLPIVVRLATDNQFFLNENKIAFGSLSGEITKRIAAKNPEDEIVYIVGKSDVGFKRIVQILKFGRQAENDDFGLIVADESETRDVSKAEKVKIVLEEYNPKTDKPSPLFLGVALGANGKIALNAKPHTPETLAAELRRTFEQRKQKKIYIAGSTDVDKTVFVKAALSAKYGDVMKIIELVRNAGAYPIAVEIDGLPQ